MYGPGTSIERLKDNMSGDRQLNCAYSREGEGRCRKGRAPATKAKSHYQFAEWVIRDGYREGRPAVAVKFATRSRYPLISTVVINASTGTETLLWMHFDLDYERASKQWKKAGLLDWPTIAAVLEAELPEFYKHVTAVTRSSGGRGLALALAISPLELTTETSQIQYLAYRLQSCLISILNFYGLGADPGAKGLKRLMPNFFQESRVIDRDQITESIIQSNRPRVIQNLLYSVRFHRALKPKNKRDRDDILWSDKRVERSCAQLYIDILEEFGPWGSMLILGKDFIKNYRMSKNTGYKFLKNPPSWLAIEKIRGEGYRISLKAKKSLTDRARDLLDGPTSTVARAILPSLKGILLTHPTSIVKGQRNQWLVSAALTLKWKGISFVEALNAIKEASEKVPTFKSSQSLSRDLERIVTSIFSNREETYASQVDLIIPSWLENEIKKLRENFVSQIFIKKGTYEVGFHSSWRRPQHSGLEGEVSGLDQKKYTSFGRSNWTSKIIYLKIQKSKWYR